MPLNIDNTLYMNIILLEIHTTILFVQNLLDIRLYFVYKFSILQMAEFIPEVNALTPQFEKLLKCCDSLLHNDGIKHFLIYVLTLGNFINMVR